VAAVRGFIGAYGESRFQEINADHAAVESRLMVNRAGWRKRDGKA